MKIKIFTTGGTIDKVYFDAKNNFQVGDPEIGSLLKEAKVTFDFEIVSLLQKDSLDFTDEDRELVHQSVLQESCERILITHGTDTMVQTAMNLLDIEGKTIVLTGSMQPARLQISDAEFNIGSAIAAVQLLEEGVYIVMNGGIFDPQNCIKNLEIQSFEKIDAQKP